MANKARRKGTEAENGVADYLALWYPGEDEEEEGRTWNRHTSKGMNDEGDVLGPFTSVEVKNYTNPPVSGLLDNAERKGVMSKRRYWFLVYKRKGFGNARAYEWNAMTTLGALTQRFGVTLDDPELSTPDALLAAVPDLCAEWVVKEAHFKEPAPRREFPEFTWKPVVLFSDIMSSVQKRRDAWVESEGYSYLDRERRIIPFVVTPRRDPEGMRPVEDWYVYSRFGGFVWMLEGLGVIPQDPSDYLQASELERV